MKKILIVYRSKYGFTGDCVKQMKKDLGNQATCVDLGVTIPESIAEYDVILIGGSIYAGMIQKEVKAFCTKHQDILLTKTVAIFGSCGLAEGFEKTIRENLSQELVDHSEQVVCLGGEFRMDKMKFFDKAIIKMMTKSKGGQLPSGRIEEAYTAFIKKI